MWVDARVAHEGVQVAPQSVLPGLERMYDELDITISSLESSYDKLGAAISSLGKPGPETSDILLETADIIPGQCSVAPLKLEKSEDIDDEQWEAPTNFWMSKRSVEHSVGDENLVSKESEERTGERAGEDFEAGHSMETPMKGWTHMLRHPSLLRSAVWPRFS